MTLVELEKKIFNGDEFDNVDVKELTKISYNLRNKFSDRKTFFEKCLDKLSIDDDWERYLDTLTLFHNKHAEWQRKYSTIEKNPDKEKYVEFFHQGNEIYAPIEMYFKEHREMKRKFIDETKEYFLNELSESKKSIFDKINLDVELLKSDVKTSFKEGIDSLFGLKTDLELEGVFQKHISSQILNAKRSKNVYLFLFILSIILIPFILYSTTKLTGNDLNSIFIKAGISIPLFVLSYFFFNQYKLYQLMQIKNMHLAGFIGGGATFINQVCAVEPDVKKEVQVKMANLFLDLNDINNLIKKTKHPVDLSLDHSLKIVDKIGNLTSKTKQIKNTIG